MKASVKSVAKINLYYSKCDRCEDFFNSLNSLSESLCLKHSCYLYYDIWFKIQFLIKQKDTYICLYLSL